jgi:uncharacterized membrane protein YdjX (TVP38/TMEM64 family)
MQIVLPASTDEKARQQRRRLPAWTWLLLAALLAGSLYLLQSAAAFGDPGLERWLAHHADFLALIREYPATAMLAVFVMHALLAALALPGASVLMLAAGSGFGALGGTLLCLSGCTAGATLSMLAARHWLQPFVRRRYGAQLADFDARIAADGRAYLFSLRLLPVLPFAVVNVAAGLSAMRTWTFVWISLVGMAASTFVYVNAGTELAHVRELADVWSPRVLASLAALALMPWLMKPIVRRLQPDAGA